jgi:hypothetical protein
MKSMLGSAYVGYFVQAIDQGMSDHPNESSTKREWMEDHEPARQMDLTSESISTAGSSAATSRRCKHLKQRLDFVSSEDTCGMGRGFSEHASLSLSRFVHEQHRGKRSRKLSLSWAVCLLFFVSLFFEPILGSISSPSSQRNVEAASSAANFRIPTRQSRQLLQQQYPEPSAYGVQQDGVCLKEALPNGVNPALWLYAGAQGGIPQHGLSVSTLVTDGYPGSDPIVGEWKGMLCCPQPPLLQHKATHFFKRIAFNSTRTACTLSRHTRLHMIQI